MSGPRANDFEMPAVHVPFPGRVEAPSPVNQAWVPGPNIASDKGDLLAAPSGYSQSDDQARAAPLAHSQGDPGGGPRARPVDSGPARLRR